MRRLSAGLIAVALLMLAIVGSQGLGRAEEPATGQRNAVTRWEYRSIAQGDSSGLAKLGEEGWEGYAATSNIHSGAVRIHLKRVKHDAAGVSAPAKEG